MAQVIELRHLIQQLMEQPDSRHLISDIYPPAANQFQKQTGAFGKGF